MIARKNCGCGCDLLSALLDELFENPGTSANAGFNLSQRVLPIGVPNEKVSGALQERQKSDEEKKQSAAETVESEFQR